MNDEVMVSIPKTEYDRLLSDSALLCALHAAGVDSWEGYEDAMDDFEGE